MDKKSQRLRDLLRQKAPQLETGNAVINLNSAALYTGADDVDLIPLRVTASPGIAARISGGYAGVIGISTTEEIGVWGWTTGTGLLEKAPDAADDIDKDKDGALTANPGVSIYGLTDGGTAGRFIATGGGRGIVGSTDDATMAGVVARNTATPTPGPALVIEDGYLDMTTNKIVNLLDPVNAQDAATRNYVLTSEGSAANAIPHDGTLTLPEAMAYANADKFHVGAYGAWPGASESANTAGINAAIADAKAAGSGTVQLRPGTYAYDGCLDLCDTSDVHLIGSGGHYGTVLECHNAGKAAIEAIGSNRIKFENIKIVGHATDTPAVAIWTGRSTATAGRNTSQIWCERVFVTGHFTLAAWYNTGCESVQLFGCNIYMEKATCKAGVMHDWENTAGTGDTANALTPEHATLLTSYLGNPLVQALGLISHSFLTAVDTAVAYSPVYIVNETSAVQLRNTYVVAWGAPIYYMLGAGVLEVFTDYVEGTPTYIVHGDYHAGDSNDFTFHLSGCGNAVCSSGSALWFDDDTTVLNSLIERSDYQDDLRFYDINASRIAHWSNYNAAVNPALVVANQSVNCYFEIENADTYTNADPFNTTVVFNSNVYAGYIHLHGLAINKGNVPGATGEAVIQRILRGSASWSPPEIADDAQAVTTVAITGVTAADPWFCMAHYSGIVTGAYEISAYALDGNVAVCVTNRTGSPVTLTGTLSVVAWKITAA